MSKTKTPEAVTLFFTGEPLTITIEEATALEAYRTSPGYVVLTRCLRAMEKGAADALGAPDTALDSIRYLQGRLSVATDVRELLEVGVPAWLASKEPMSAEQETN